MSGHIDRALIGRVTALVTGRWLQDSLRLVIFLWLARSNVDGYGLFTFALGVAILMRSPLYLDQFTIRELAGGKNDQGAVLSQMVRLKCTLGALMLLGLAVFGWLKGWGPGQMAVVVVVSLHQMLEAISDTLYSLYRTQGRQGQEAIRGALAHILGSLYGAFALWMGWDVLLVVMFLLISSGLRIVLALYSGGGGPQMPVMHRKGPIWPRGQVVSLLAIVAISLMGSFFNNVQIFFLKQFKELSEVAYYGATSDMAGGIVGLLTALVIGGVLYPTLANAAAKGKEAMASATQTFFWQMVAYGLATTFFFVTLGPDVLLLLYGPKYQAAEIPLQIMGLAVFFSFINNLLNHVMLAERREKLVVLFHLLPTVISIILGLILIPRLGPSGAALNLLVCRASFSILVVGYAQYRYRVLQWSLMGPVLLGALILAAGYGLYLLTPPDFLLPRLVPLLALGLYFLWVWRWTLRVNAASDGDS